MNVVLVYSVDVYILLVVIPYWYFFLQCFAMNFELSMHSALMYAKNKPLLVVKQRYVDGRYTHIYHR